MFPLLLNLVCISSNWTFWAFFLANVWCLIHCFLMVFSMLWYSPLSVIFFKCVSVSLMLSPVLTRQQCLWSMLEIIFLTLSTSCQQILGRHCQLVFQFEFQTLWNKFFSYGLTEEVNSFIFESIYFFSAIFSLYLWVDCSCS